MNKASQILVVLLITTTSCIHAQSSLFWRIHEAQVVLNKNSSLDHEVNTGVGLGLYSKIISKEKYNLLVGLEYVQSSLYVESINTAKRNFGGYINTDISFNSLSIPLFARHIIGEKHVLLFEYGAYVDFQVMGRIEGTKANNSLTDPVDFESVSENFNEVFLGFHLGVGYMYSVSDKWGIVISPFLRRSNTFLAGYGGENRVSSSYYGLGIKFSGL